MNLTVWVLFHRWDGDESVDLKPTKKAAEDAIQSYVMDQWDEGGMEGLPPDDPEEMIEQYFSYHEDEEWYSIYSKKIDFPGLELPDEEVVLSSDECAVVVMALELEGLGKVAAHAGLATDEASADELIQSAYQKLKD